jgi:outer membrane protein insertion porin family
MANTRWVQLRIPVSEGERYKVGKLTFAGNALVASETLRALVKLNDGDWYSQGAIREALTKARELYGAAGYMEFVALPEITPTEPTSPTSSFASTRGRDTSSIASRSPEHADARRGDPAELRLVEGGVFNTAALKDSVRRLNQLGYFKPLKGTDQELHVEKARIAHRCGRHPFDPRGAEPQSAAVRRRRVAVRGAFGNISYTTSNFLGRGKR